MFNFEKLHVFKDALELTDEIYEATKTWPIDEKLGLIDQIRRAATSIALNIAEGSSRSKKEFCHFLDMARGSCYECVAVLLIAKNRFYLKEKRYQDLYAEIEKISRKISALKKSLQ